MNLHDIRPRSATDRAFAANRRFSDWLRDNPPVMEALQPYQQEWVNRWYNEPRGSSLWLQPNETVTWDTTQPGQPPSPGPTWAAPMRVRQIVDEVYRFRYELDRARITGNRIAFRVSPQEYRELEAAYVGNRDDYAIHVDYGTDRMTVMGIHVISER